MSDRTDDAGPEALAPRPSAAGLPQPGDVVAERYRIEREIGHGGMAVVYAATQLGEGTRQVALKWLFQGRSHREERRRRFLREARAAGAVQHPNVVRVFDAGEHKDGVFLVMELVDGESLTKYLEAHGKLAPRDAIDLLMPVMRGMAAAHKKGVIHRDLKPDNLCVGPPRASGGQPEIKVLDFGLSKLIGPAADSLHTIPGTLVGTPQYMAPEQADHRLGAVSERSDVYTLGVILYEAIAGRRPFQSETLAGQLMKIAHDEPTPLRDVIDVHEDLAGTIMWSLARDPMQRPATVEDFAVELEQFGSIGFADDGRMSENKGSMRPRKLSERAPAPASVRVPAPAPVPAVPGAQPRPAASESAHKPQLWLIGGAILLLVIAALTLLRVRESGREAATASEASEPETGTPSTPAKAPTPPATAGPVPAAPMPSPAQAPVDEATAEPAPAPEGPSNKRQRSARGPAPAPAPTAPPPAESAPQAAPSSKQRNKQSPGVADPWAD